MLATVMNYDHLYLGGGNSSASNSSCRNNVTIVSNDAGMEGGAFVWHPKGPRRPLARIMLGNFLRSSVRYRPRPGLSAFGDFNAAVFETRHILDRSG